ncbi:MAG: phosphotransferase family protein [Ilumatobacteraceae bacterium]
MDELRLAQFLTSHIGAPVEVHNSSRFASSYSRVSYAVDTSAGRFIVRLEHGDAPRMSSADEFQLMQSLQDVGFPVANARWVEPTGDFLGGPFVVIDHPEVRPVDQQAVDETAAAAFVTTLARLHRLDVSAHLPAVDSAQATHIQIERWRTVGKSVGGPRVPFIDTVEIWLHQNVPLGNQVALVHGAARPGNIVVSDGEAVSMSDWDTAHVGDPAEDWAYYLATRRVPTSSRQLWVGLFEREAGVRLSTQQWRYWEAFNLYKKACMNRACLALFESGVDSSPSQAIAGTAEYHSFLARLMHIVE